MTNEFKYQLIEILSWKYWNVIMKYATMNYFMSVICKKKKKKKKLIAHAGQHYGIEPQCYVSH